MQLIKLTTEEGAIVVNMDQLQFMVPAPSGGTTLSFGYNYRLVKESIDDILLMVNNDDAEDEPTKE